MDPANVLATLSYDVKAKKVRTRAVLAGGGSERGEGASSAVCLETRRRAPSSHTRGRCFFQLVGFGIDTTATPTARTVVQLDPIFNTYKKIATVGSTPARRTLGGPAGPCLQPRAHARLFSPLPSSPAPAARKLLYRQRRHCQYVFTPRVPLRPFWRAMLPAARLLTRLAALSFSSAH